MPKSSVGELQATLARIMTTTAQTPQQQNRAAAAMQNAQAVLAAQYEKERAKEAKKQKKSGLLSTVGGLLGGAVGTAVMPGVGTAIGSSLGQGLGGVAGGADPGAAFSNAAVSGAFNFASPKLAGAIVPAQTPDVAPPSSIAPGQQSVTPNLVPTERSAPLLEPMFAPGTGTQGQAAQAPGFLSRFGSALGQQAIGAIQPGAFSAAPLAGAFGSGVSDAHVPYGLDPRYKAAVDQQYTDAAQAEQDTAFRQQQLGLQQQNLGLAQQREARQATGQAFGQQLDVRADARAEANQPTVEERQLDIERTQALTKQTQQSVAQGALEFTPQEKLDQSLAAEERAVQNAIKVRQTPGVPSPTTPDYVPTVSDDGVYGYELENAQLPEGVKFVPRSQTATGGKSLSQKDLADVITKWRRMLSGDILVNDPMQAIRDELSIYDPVTQEKLLSIADKLEEQKDKGDNKGIKAVSADELSNRTIISPNLFNPLSP